MRKKIFYIIILINCINLVESLRRFGFLNLTHYPLHSNIFSRILHSKSLPKEEITQKPTQFCSKSLNNLFAKNDEINENLTSDELFNCPGINHIFNKSFVFSGDFEDLGVNGILSRELDYRKFSLETHKGLKKLVAVGVSAVAVGILYKFASFLKDLIEQQNILLNKGNQLYNTSNTTNQEH